MLNFQCSNMKFKEQWAYNEKRETNNEKQEPEQLSLQNANQVSKIYCQQPGI